MDTPNHLHIYLFSLSFCFQSAPNVVIFLIDDMPFIEEWAESAPTGNRLEGLNVTLKSYHTPNINAFRDEAVIFTKSYCASPKVFALRIDEVSSF